MRLRTLLAALFLIAAPSLAQAQCSGTFSAGEVCGNSTASTGVAKRTTGTAWFDRVFCTTNGALLSRVGGSWVCADSSLSWDNSLRRLVINLSGGSLKTTETDNAFQTIGATGNANTFFMDSVASTSAIDFRRYNGTYAVPTAIASGDTMGQINYQGYDGTTTAKSARVRATATEAWTASAHGTKLQFFTTANGTTSNSAKVEISGAGDVTIPTTGVLYRDTFRLLHEYKPATSNGGNTFVGTESGNFTMDPGGGAATLASANVGVGFRTLFANTTGHYNAALGYSALAANTTGKDQVAVGYGALSLNTTGYDNTALGWLALGANTVGYANTAVGYASLISLAGGDGSVTASRNVAVGVQSLLTATTGNDNVTVGVHGLFLTTTGTFNVGFGNYSGYNNTTGSRNIFIGPNSGYNATTESDRFFLGNVQQASIANDKAYSLLYGQLSGSAASLTNQQLTVNGAFTVNGAATVTSINFGGSTLSTYVEGSFTPIDASGAALSFSAATGNYTRIGRMVFAYGQVTYPATADVSGAKIGGLPVTSLSGQYARQCQVGARSEATLAALQLTASATTFDLVNNVGAAITNATMSTDLVWFICIYPSS